MDNLPQPTTATLPADMSWGGCVAAFKNADKMMGNLFHVKVQAIGIARKLYIKNNGKEAGFVLAFSEDAEIAYSYASQINRIEKTFSGRDMKNFSANAANLLLTVPEEEREEFLEEHGDNPITITDVKTFKEASKLEDDVDEGIEYWQEVGLEVERTRDGVYTEFSGDLTKEEFVEEYKRDLAKEKEEKEASKPSLTTSYNIAKGDDAPDDFEVIEAVRGDDPDYDFKPIPEVKTSVRGQVAQLFYNAYQTTDHFTVSDLTADALRLFEENPDSSTVAIAHLKAYIPLLQELLDNLNNELPRGKLQ